MSRVLELQEFTFARKSITITTKRWHIGWLSGAPAVIGFPELVENGLFSSFESDARVIAKVINVLYEVPACFTAYS